MYVEKGGEQMRTKFMSIAFASALILMLSLQFLVSSNEASAISVTVSIEPETLNLRKQGKWITAHIELPEPYDVSDVNVSSVMLDGTIPAEWGNVEGETIMVKFDASAAIDYIWITKLYHLGFDYMDTIRPDDNIEVELRVTGRFFDGTTTFEGTDTVKMINP